MPRDRDAGKLISIIAVAELKDDVPIFQFEVLYGLPNLECRLKALLSRFQLFGVVIHPVKGLRLVDLDFGMLRNNGQIDVMLVPNEAYKNISSKFQKEL